MLGEFLDAIEPLGDTSDRYDSSFLPSFGPDMLATLRSFVGRLPQSHQWGSNSPPTFYDGGAAHSAVDELFTTRYVGRVVLDTRPEYSLAADVRRRRR